MPCARSEEEWEEESEEEEDDEEWQNNGEEEKEAKEEERERVRRELIRVALASPFLRLFLHTFQQDFAIFRGELRYACFSDSVFLLRVDVQPYVA